MLFLWCCTNIGVGMLFIWHEFLAFQKKSICRCKKIWKRRYISNTNRCGHFLSLLTSLHHSTSLSTVLKCDHRINLIIWIWIQDYKQALPLLALALFKLTVFPYSLVNITPYKPGSCVARREMELRRSLTNRHILE